MTVDLGQFEDEGEFAPAQALGRSRCVSSHRKTSLGRSGLPWILNALVAARTRSRGLKIRPLRGTNGSYHSHAKNETSGFRPPVHIYR